MNLSLTTPAPARRPRTRSVPLDAVPGLPETRMSADALALLPPSVPGPWSCQARAVLWWQHAPAPEFDWALPHRMPLAVAGFVDYLDTPVGPYREVLAATALRDGASPIGQIPFIAVDSPASLHGGRFNWALPKTLASFEGDIGEGAATAYGDDWKVSVSASRRGAQMPLRGSFACISPYGRYATRLRAKARPVTIETDAQGPTLTGWLGSGRHLGLLLEGQMEITAPDRR